MIKILRLFAFTSICFGANFANAAECETPNQFARPIARFDIMNAYPQEAARRNLEGKVSIEVNIDKDGNVTDAKIIEASDKVFYANSLIDAAKSMKFTPAKKDCEFVDSTYKFNMVLRIH